MNDPFWWQKSRFGFQLRFFGSLNVDCIKGLTEKVPRRRAVRRRSRPPSIQVTGLVFDENDVRGVRW